MSTGTKSTKDICAHIQQRICAMRRPLYSLSSKSTCAEQWVQRTRMSKL
jgi:hypothetical protein